MAFFFDSGCVEKDFLRDADRIKSLIIGLSL